MDTSELRGGRAAAARVCIDEQRGARCSLLETETNCRRCRNRPVCSSSNNNARCPVWLVMLLLQYDGLFISSILGLCSNHISPSNRTIHGASKERASAASACRLTFECIPSLREPQFDEKRSSHPRRPPKYSPVKTSSARQAGRRECTPCAGCKLRRALLTWAMVSIAASRTSASRCRAVCAPGGESDHDGGIRQPLCSKNGYLRPSLVGAMLCV
jgi:hypothetical protein